MAKSAAPFTQSDVTRAVKDAKAAGVDVARIKIAKDGTIEIDTGKPQEADGTTIWYKATEDLSRR